MMNELNQTRGAQLLKESIWERLSNLVKLLRAEYVGWKVYERGDEEVKKFYCVIRRRIKLIMDFKT